MEDLKANEENFLFPPRFVLKVTKESECNADLNTSIIVTLCKNEEKKSMESIPFNLFVSIIEDINMPAKLNKRSAYVSCTKSPPPPEYMNFVELYTRSSNESQVASIARGELTYSQGYTDILIAKNSLTNNHHCDKNKPKLADLTKYSTKISSCWQEIALQLNIPDYIVSTIDLNHQYTERKCYAMFEKWLTITEYPCWCHFIKALYFVRLNGVAEEAKTHLKPYENVHSCIQTVSDTHEIDENNSTNDQINLHELRRYLKDIPDGNLIYFIHRLLHKESAIAIIKDIRRGGGGAKTEGNIKKICEEFLKEKDPSWAKVYKALKDAECDDLADIVDACFLPI